MSPSTEVKLYAQSTADLSPGAIEHLRIVGQRNGLASADFTLQTFRQSDVDDDDEAMEIFHSMFARWN